MRDNLDDMDENDLRLLAGAYTSATIQAEVTKLYEKNNVSMRDEFAMRIMAGMCAGDWKFDASIKSWDEVAVARAYEIADAMIKERDISNV